MKRTLMTASELKKRYKPSKALDLSIEKWERLGFKERWDTLREDAEKYVWGDTCGLCQKYRKCPNKCPLVECDEDGHPWGIALDAISYNDRPAFMKARNNLLKRMKRAKARGEK